jgi:hypothetical protein
VLYHSGKPLAVVNRVGIVPSAYVEDPELRKGLETAMKSVNLYMDWVEGAPIIELDQPLLDEVFSHERFSPGATTGSR